jgi:hypothetical protein
VFENRDDDGEDERRGDGAIFTFKTSSLGQNDEERGAASLFGS